MQRQTAKLEEQFRESARLEREIRANLFYMRAFAEAYPNEEIVQQLAGQMPWWHNCVLLDNVKRSEECIVFSAGTSSTVGAGMTWSTRSRATFK